MSDCCGGFTQLTRTAIREASGKIMPLNNCGDRDNYVLPAAAAGANAAAVALAAIKEFVPVKFGTVAGTVVPALDGVGAIGIAVSAKLATDLNRNLTVARTGYVKWASVAASLGASVTDQAAWWPIHIELAKINIYVEFN